MSTHFVHEDAGDTSDEEWPSFDNQGDEVFEPPKDADDPDCEKGWYYFSGHTSNMAPNNRSCPFLCIKDDISNRHIIVDTGSSMSLWPAQAVKHLPPKDNNTRLFGAGGAPIATYGVRNIRVYFCGWTRPHTICFVIADVCSPLLGADFLVSTGYLINMRNHTLVETEAPPTRKPCIIVGQAMHVPHAVPDVVPNSGVKLSGIFSYPDNG